MSAYDRAEDAENVEDTKPEVRARVQTSKEHAPFILEPVPVRWSIDRTLRPHSFSTSPTSFAACWMPLQ